MLLPVTEGSWVHTCLSSEKNYGTSRNWWANVDKCYMRSTTAVQVGSAPARLQAMLDR